MKIDTEQLKQNNPIETVIGRYLDLKKDGSGFKACCPFHGEKTPSFNVNPNLKTFKCFGCGEGGDVVGFIMKYKGVEFKEACEILGAEPTPEENHKPKPKPAAKKKPAKVVPLTFPEKYEKIFTLGAVTKASGNLTENFPHFKTAWKYFNEKSEVELVVVRWENDEGKKQVLTYYYDGNKIQLKGYPVLLYNRDKLATDQESDVLIVEGEKCADAVGTLNHFIGVCWNGGAKKVDDVDFSILKNRVVYIWPDDDQKLYKHGPKKGELMSPEDQPGNVMAAAVLKHLPHAQIVDLSKIVDQLREIEPDGADIVEADQFMSDAEIIEYVYQNSGRVESHKSENMSDKAGSSSQDNDKPELKDGLPIYPFKVLGISDDKKAYFVGVNDHIHAFDPTTISKNKLMNLADIEWWWSIYGKNKEGMDMAISDLISVSTIEDFDVKRFRGRGAWAEPDGRVCYYDGKKITGEYDENRIFLRLPRNDIGISDTPATAEQRKKIFKICSELTFKTMADCAMVLGWSVMSAFAGAFEWRPCVFITAGSGTGKSTILEMVINKISAAEEYTGIDTTAAGIRQFTGADSRAITIDEFEAKDKKSLQNRSEIFGIVRQSTSNNAPKAAKGTQDGKGVKYEMKSMFLLCAISPIIDGEADEKRTIRISLAQADEDRKEWLKKKSRLGTAISEKICRGVRAYTWQNLDNIKTLAERVAEIAQIEAVIDNRTVYASSLLLAAFIVVFDDQPNPTDEYIINFVRQIHTDSPVDEPRNENEEMLDRLLGYLVRDGSEMFTVRDLLRVIDGSLPQTDIDSSLGAMVGSRARRLVGNYGIGLDPDFNIAIAKNDEQIMRILETSKGYHHQLARHPKVVSVAKNVGLGSRTVNCVVIERVVE